MTTLTDLRTILTSEVEALTGRKQADKPLWPPPYDVLTPEAAYKWLIECCWTYNEANGLIELIPDHDYIRRAVDEWFEAKRLGRPIIYEKSRRLIFSWIMRGLRLWTAGLHREKGLIAGLNYPKAAEHVWRVWWLYNELQTRRPEFNLKPCTPRDGNVAAQQLGQVLLPNGSLIESLNQDGASFQGSGYSWVDMEEFSLYKHPEYMYAQALRVTEGKPGDTGGHVAIVTNASPSKTWQGIKSEVAGEPRERFHHIPGNSITEGDCGNGARYLFFHYSVDPKKNSDWVMIERPKVPQREWEREMEGREDIFDGEPVFIDWDTDKHCPEKFRGKERIPIQTGSIYVGAWDAGVTRTPAFVLFQINRAKQVHLILEVTSPGSEPMSLFAPRVMREVQRKIPANWPDVIHVGDQTIATKSGATNASAQSEAKKIIGCNIKPMSNTLTVMQGAVSKLLIDEMRDGEGNRRPRFVVDGCCTMVVEGFKGAYQYELRTLSDNSSRIKPEPLKNAHSDPMDAVQQGAQMVWKVLEGKVSPRRG